MFEFEANRINPTQRMTVLESFTRWWFFAPHGEETGVSPERLAQLSIPTPLKRLYSFAGEWPGGGWESISLTRTVSLLSSVYRKKTANLFLDGRTKAYG
jgi:hypothetical protein